jgi:two-component system sensor histidine kinase MprB
LVAALAIGLTTWAAILSAERQLRGAVDADLRERAAEVIKTATALPRRMELQLAQQKLRIVEFDAALQVFDRKGEPILRVGPEQVILPIDAVDVAVTNQVGRWVLRDVKIDGVSYRMITARLRRPLIDNPTAVGFQIARDVSRVDANLAGLTGRMMRMGIIGILLVGLTGWILASRAVRPVSELTEKAEQIATTEHLEGGEELDHSAPGEIGRLATAFSAMLSSLATSRREQQRLVSDAGHEFRTPITALKTNLETLNRQDRNLSDAQRRELLDAAVAQTNQLASLATELVDLATDVHQEEHPAQVDLENLAAVVAHRFRQVGPRKVVVTGKGATVTGRPLQLERALGNLVDNAVKWAAHTVQIHVEGGRVTVVDDGPGIPNKDLPHIFGRFYRSNQARAMPGSGLGLAIVKHLVTTNGGTVFARNRLGGGAEVGFEMPAQQR